LSHALGSGGAGAHRGASSGAGTSVWAEVAQCLPPDADHTEIARWLEGWAVATWARASASSAGRVNMDSWLPGTRAGETLIRSAKRSQPYSPGGSATSPSDST